MDVKEAIQKAKQYVTRVFADEGIKNVALEEVVFDSDAKEWRITIGFARPWDDDPIGIKEAIGLPPSFKRTYKIVLISEKNGEVVSVTNRDLADA